MGYYLGNGIYPQWTVLIKFIRHAQDDAISYFATHQEAARKHIESVFSVLQAQWGILSQA